MDDIEEMTGLDFLTTLPDDDEEEVPIPPKIMILWMLLKYLLKRLPVLHLFFIANTLLDPSNISELPFEDVTEDFAGL